MRKADNLHSSMTTDAKLRQCSHLVPGHQSLGTDTKTRLNFARVQIQRAYGRLKRKMNCDLDEVLLHIASACILHDMCEERKECYLEERNRRGEDEGLSQPLNDDDT